MARVHCASDFFVLRTPLLPFDELSEWSRGVRCVRALDDPVEFARLYAEDVALLRERLMETCRRPELREALFVASPSLEESLPIWERRPESERGERVEHAVVKYFTRIAARCTPFGLHAGGSVGTWAGEDRLRLPPCGEYLRHTRLDMDYLTALVDGLNRDDALRGVLRYFPNSSLFEIGGTIRYAEARLAGRLRSYFLVAAEADHHLRTTVERARAGAGRDELADALVDAEITREDALAYVNQLIDAQILVPDLAPTITGPESIDGLLDQLRDKVCAVEAVEKLTRVREALEQIDGAGLGRDPQAYRDVAALLAGLPADAELDRLFQVDMMKPCRDLALDRRLPDAILDAVEVLENLAGIPEDPLAAFRREFLDRYGDREVPLLQVMDEEVGIGFATTRAPGAETSPLLVGLDFPSPESEQRFPISPAHEFIQWKLAEALATGAQEILLDPKETASFRLRRRSPLPDALQVMGALLPQVPGDRHAPRFFMFGLSGPSGARLLGRFCHGDSTLLEHVRRHLAEEEELQPDALFCEVVHQPDGRIGNILARPLLRGHELAFLGRSGAPPDRILSLSDLTVGITGERVVLRSRSLGREVVPRLTTAHNLSLRTIKVYRFLGTLQTQGRTGGMGWDWGRLAGQPRLPRVRVGSVIVAPARWNARSEELEPAFRETGPELVRRILVWKERRELPRFAGLVEGDHVLLVDFENPLSILAFCSTIRQRKTFALREMVPGSDALAVEGPEGRFLNEVIIPMVRRPSGQDPSGPARDGTPGNAVTAGAALATAPRSVPTVFAPGSEWLFAKLYCGPSTADRLLCRVVRPLLAGFLSAGEIQRWFFVRYADPQTHLRLRFRGEPSVLLGRVLPALREAVQPLLEEGIVWRLQLDTYEREMKRYGGEEGIDLCEEIFGHDSDAVVDLLDLLPGDQGAEARWRLTVKGMDMLLDDLGFDLRAKSAILVLVSEGYTREFSVEGGLKRNILARYRTHREALETLLDPACGPGHPLRPGIELFRRRSERYRPAIGELARRAREGRLNLPLSGLAPSLLHMHANRMFRAAARAQEAVVYRFLERHYASLLARQEGETEGKLTPSE